MDAIPKSPKRILGVELGTAVLTVLLCLMFAIAIGALADSILTAVIAALALLGGVVVTSRLLPSHSVSVR